MVDIGESLSDDCRHDLRTAAINMWSDNNGEPQLDQAKVTATFKKIMLDHDHLNFNGEDTSDQVADFLADAFVKDVKQKHPYCAAHPEKCE